MDSVQWTEMYFCIISIMRLQCISDLKCTQYTKAILTFDPRLPVGKKLKLIVFLIAIR